MDGKPSERSKGDDNPSSDDDNSIQRHTTVGGGGQNRQDNSATSVVGSYYSSHITSVCEAMNSEAEKRMSPFEQLMLAERRESNRLSVKRCRKRRREEIAHLDAERRRLEVESVELTAEKARLQAELQLEIANKSATNASLQAMGLERHMSSSQHNQFLTMLQLRQRFQPAPALDPRFALFSQASIASPMGLDAASISAWQNAQRMDATSFAMDNFASLVTPSFSQGAAATTTGGGSYPQAAHSLRDASFGTPSFLHQLQPNSFPLSFLPSNQTLGVASFARDYLALQPQLTAAASAAGRAVNFANITAAAAMPNQRDATNQSFDGALRFHGRDDATLISRRASSGKRSSKFGEE